MAVPSVSMFGAVSDPASLSPWGMANFRGSSQPGPITWRDRGAQTLGYGRREGGPEREDAMEQYVGLDVSLESTSICVVDAAGTVVWRGTVVSTPEVIAAAIRARAAHVVRIGLETGPLCTWHWHGLRELGLPVVCVDARHAQAALSMQVNKTDPNDGMAWRSSFAWDGTRKLRSRASVATGCGPCSRPARRS